MTKAQFKRLEDILGRLEILEREISDSTIREKLNNGKNELIEAWKLMDPTKPAPQRATSVDKAMKGKPCR